MHSSQVGSTLVKIRRSAYQPISPDANLYSWLWAAQAHTGLRDGDTKIECILYHIGWSWYLVLRDHLRRRTPVTAPRQPIVDDDKLNKLGQVFAAFAEESFRGSSPLYETLAQGISKDRDLLAIASSARRPPVPNLLFGAVHYMLLSGAAHTLASSYASLADEPGPPSDAYPHFRDFCLAHEDELRELIATRLVQTNEVARCSYMLPAFAFIAGETPQTALSLIDVGTSAGLNLLWDRYAYDYGGTRAGVASSPVQIEAEVRGQSEPPIPEDLPEVAFRAGIDLSPVDLTDEDSALWLRALVWPEHESRAAQLQAAIALARDDPPELVEGDAIDVLAQVGEQAPQESTLCIYNDHALYQFSQEARRRFGAIVEELSAARDVYWLSAEGRWGYDHAVLQLVKRSKGLKSSRELAKVDLYGRWLEWMA